MTEQDTLQRDITAAKTLYNSDEYFITEQTVFRHVHGDKENGKHVVVYTAHWPEHAGMTYTSDKWVAAAFPAKNSEQFDARIQAQTKLRDVAIEHAAQLLEASEWETAD